VVAQRKQVKDEGMSANYFLSFDILKRVVVPFSVVVFLPPPLKQAWTVISSEQAPQMTAFVNIAAADESCWRFGAASLYPAS
jgi:hypothetical protein